MSLRRNSPLYLGVFLVSGSTTLLEISLTRVFSVSLWYQFGFMIISTALLGFGASGTYIAVKKGALTGDLRKKLATSATLYSLSILVAFGLMTRIPLRSAQAGDARRRQCRRRHGRADRMDGLYYAIIVVPFFFAGLTIGTALFSVGQGDREPLLCGSARRGFGALVVVFALYRLTGQGSVVLASIGAALGALVFSLTPLARQLPAGAAAEPAAGAGRTGPARRTRGRWASGIYVLVLLVLVLPNAASVFNLYIPPSKPFSIAYDKTEYPDLNLEYTGWTPFSRIDVMWQPRA